MDADGLPIVGTGIDYTKVGAIHQKRTLAFLNHFITHTARFLNRFSCVCEQKLSNLSVRIQRLETTMNILEAKISSVPGLEGVTAATSSSSQPTPAAQTQSTDTTTQGPTAPQAPAQQAAAQEAPPPPEPEPEQNVMKVKDDPRYAKYFKMLNMGVPAPALSLKMKQEGLDPDLLETPDAPAPAGGQSSKKADSDDSFSDDDDDKSDGDKSDDDSDDDFSD